MPRKSSLKAIVLTDVELHKLKEITDTELSSNRKAIRAKIILLNQKGYTNKLISELLSVNRHTVELTLNKCIRIGVMGALKDERRSGRSKHFSDDEIAWINYIVNIKPFDLAMPFASWTLLSLYTYIQNNCIVAGYPALKNISRSKIWSVISENKAKVQNTNYIYIKSNDVEIKMHLVLFIYKKFDWLDFADQLNLKSRSDYNNRTTNSQIGLLSGIDLHDGFVSAAIGHTYNPNDFIDFLKKVDQHYDFGSRILINIDFDEKNDSNELKVFLKAKPNRFIFEFMPENEYCLDLIESLFNKILHFSLIENNATSKDDFASKLLDSINRFNQFPSVRHWSDKIFKK